MILFEKFSFLHRFVCVSLHDFVVVVFCCRMLLIAVPIVFVSSLLDVSVDLHFALLYLTWSFDSLS